MSCLPACAAGSITCPPAGAVGSISVPPANAAGSFSYPPATAVGSSTCHSAMDFSRHPQQRSVRDTPGRLSLSEIPRDFPAEEQVLTPNMGQRGTLDPEGVELELLRRGLYDLERLCTRQKGTENSL